VSGLRTLLVQGGMISQFDLASGFPGVLPRGMDVVERYQQRYLAALAARFPVTEVMTPLLTPSAAYRSDYGHSYDYGNTFELAVDGHPHMVRPDSLTAMIRLAVGRDTDSVLVCRQPLFRSEMTDPQPFARDRHIWGVIQVVHHDREGVPDLLARHAEAVVELHTALRIPVLLVQAPPLRDHARQRLLTFSLTPAGHLWLTSTIYEIAPSFAAAAGATGPVLEVGVTAKLVALAALLHRDDAGLRLPTALAPADVEVAAGTPPQLVQALDRAGLTSDQLSQSFRAAIRRAEKSGTPVLIGQETSRPAGQGPDRLAVFARSRRSVDRAEAADEAVGMALTALSRHDEDLMAAAIRVQDPLHDITADCDGWLDRAPRPADAPGHPLGTVLAANYESRPAEEPGHLLGTAPAANHEPASAPDGALLLIGRKPRFY
jgi:hypothetical protein